MGVEQAVILGPPSGRPARLGALLFGAVVLVLVVVIEQPSRSTSVIVFGVLAAGTGLWLRSGSKGTRRSLGSLLLAGGVVVPVVVVGLAWGGFAVLLGAPPRPEKTLVPEVISRVVRSDFIVGECSMSRLTLENGRTIDLRLLGDARAKCGDGPWVTGVPELTGSFANIPDRVGGTVAQSGLLLYGHDGAREWIAGAYLQDGPSSPCPYYISGRGYDEGGVLHFSSGLVIKKAARFENKTPWVSETTKFGDGDQICVDERGDAVSIDRFVPY
jgi:hypothetical protein